MSIEDERVKLIAPDYEKDAELIAFGAKAYSNKQKYGATDWYHWCSSDLPGRWGTKWNSTPMDDPHIYDGSNRIEFQTAWSPPEPVIVRLSEMFPDAQFRNAWADEDIGMNVGEITYQEGEAIEYDVPSGGSKEAYEMAADIIGFDLREWGYRFSMRDGTYHYKEGMDIRELSCGDNVFNSGSDFQCDQTNGFPTILCWNQDDQKAWLEPNSAFDDESPEAKQCHKDCGEWGVHPCCSWEDYNALLESLGEDAAQTAVPIEDDDESEEFGGMNLS
jgi:hypothetical protein